MREERKEQGLTKYKEFVGNAIVFVSAFLVSFCLLVLVAFLFVGGISSITTIVWIYIVFLSLFSAYIFLKDVRGEEFLGQSLVLSLLAFGFLLLLFSLMPPYKHKYKEEVQGAKVSLLEYEVCKMFVGDFKQCPLFTRGKLRAEREAILDRYNWDGAGEEELLRRVMLYSNLSPEELGRYFPKQELGRVFLKNIHDFDEEKRKLWINYLNIPEEEVKWKRK